MSFDILTSYNVLWEYRGRNRPRDDMMVNKLYIKLFFPQNINDGNGGSNEIATFVPDSATSTVAWHPQRVLIVGRSRSLRRRLVSSASGFHSSIWFEPMQLSLRHDLVAAPAAFLFIFGNIVRVSIVFVFFFLSTRFIGDRRVLLAVCRTVAVM